MVNEDKYKFPTLIDLYDSMTITQAVIFCNERERVDWVTEQMREKNFSVCSIHAGLEQKERDKIMDEFRTGQYRVLIGILIYTKNESIIIKQQLIYGEEV